MFDLSIYCGHNASITLARDGIVLEVVEIERFTNIKNAGLLWYYPTHLPLKAIQNILNYLSIKYKADKFEYLICNQDDTRTLTSRLGSKNKIVQFFKANKLKEVYHQDGHAAGAFYQSELDTAIIATVDGGGNDGCYNFYKADKIQGIEPIGKNYEYNIGEKYAEIGHYCKSIRKGKKWNDAYLVYAGKLMGLAGYGKVQENYVQALEEFYIGHHITKESRDINYKELKSKLNLPEELSGKIEVDLVATSQFVFENIFERNISTLFELMNNNFIISGGCALNILNNTKINNKVKTFIPPNPNDSGLSLGFMLSHIKPTKAVTNPYLGPEAWDRNTLSEYASTYKAELNINIVVDDIISGKIVGIVRGRCEIGPRALGNRSIICYPVIKGMKDILNSKVKNREYYRPFAPVVRLEDVSKYFEFSGESRYMSFSPKVKEEYRNTLESITHIDNTARIQTVTAEQNPFIYELLTRLEEKTGIGILLNTSFNIAGKPILNTYRDAIWILNNTDLDSILLEEYYIK
jgi:carbamoyltransferase